MMTTKVCWLLLGLIHVPPVFGLFRPAILTRLYGVTVEGNVVALLRHRAALFLVIFVICMWSIFRAEVRPMATVTVGISMIAFVAVWLLSGMPGSLRSIFAADLVGLPVLGVVGWHAFHKT
jgi:hypothetical protein